MELDDTSIDLKLLTPSLRTTHGDNKLPLIKPNDDFNMSNVITSLLIILLVLFIFYRQIFDYIPSCRNSQPTTVCIAQPQ